ncbi:hypothetical protein, unlikely [Trypanosoma brucei gambiense DAL972]|uniref:Uncharacterized protein n=1 Tax=Trypanosoma brucei gambiense (strain MHOM/CI/86/DAL972) TaxID=679716 RepID=C9ZP77_TRYB9|nr:hypothetical protein, unlikely [Trypanosoma brucei gambiense DAL972]CBH11205.1 hypothetical protein, unlikely [Trypanosoma brucei gambiense DAL972]|eukprot:XP_011773492.1 hypothetical protein, unlikely [Trypanosoma brucei gambiense DAL972]
MHQYIPQHIISNIYIYIYIYKRSHSSLPLSSCTPLPSVLLTCQVPEEVATSLLAFLGTPPLSFPSVLPFSFTVLLQLLFLTLFHLFLRTLSGLKEEKRESVMCIHVHVNTKTAKASMYEETP